MDEIEETFVNVNGKFYLIKPTYVRVKGGSFSLEGKVLGVTQDEHTSRLAKTHADLAQGKTTRRRLKL